MKYCLICLLTIGLFACNNKKTGDNPVKKDPADIAGGACDYRHDTMPATVLKITQAGNTTPSVFFTVQRGSRMDTVSYFMTNGHDLTPDEIKQNGVEKGAVFQFIESEITSGSCNPHLKHINLQKYAGKMPAAIDVAR